MATLIEEPPSPLAHLSDEQIEAIGREFEQLHEDVFADLGDRDARYIHGIIGLQRRLAAARPRAARRVALPAALAGRHRRRSRWPRSSRTWRSATTSCTASGTG